MTASYFAFDRFIFVDWSASAKPKKGKDSIWIASCESSYENKFDFVDLTDNFHKNGNNENLWKIFLAKPSSVNTLKRTDALTFLEGILKQCNNNDKNIKTLIGFDFGFGYPHAAYQENMLGEDWKSLWKKLHNEILCEKCGNEKEDRFVLAEKWNKEWSEEHGLRFWGKPVGSTYDHKYKNLPRTRPKNIKEFRITEERVRWSGVKSQWQLFSGVTVGSQTLLGIPYVEKLRQCLSQKAVKVWPFETKFATDIKDDLEVLICEIHFGAIVRVGEMVDKRKEEIRDKVQVEEMCRFFAEEDKDGSMLQKFLEVDCDCVSPCQKKIAQEKEGWILGVPLCLQPCDRPHKK